MPRPRERLLDAESLAASGAVIDREFPVADFARLADRLARPDGEATARLALSRVEGLVAGDLVVRATVEMTCQRCLGSVRQTVESETRLAFVPLEETPAPADRERIVGDPRRLDFAALVEDELLLSLPIIPRHAEPGTCAAAGAKVGATRPGTAPGGMRRPFAGLKDLLKH